jgi:acetyl-CoA acetyltransferase
MNRELRNKVAIVGIGSTKVVRHADVAIGSLAVEVSDRAIKDAGLRRSDIDGISCGTSVPADRAMVKRPGFDFVNSDFLAEHMELRPDWALDHGSFPPALAQAVVAVASGAASTVLVNRTVHNPPTGRYHDFRESTAEGRAQWTAPYGFVGWISGMAMAYMQYQQRYGARREHMATYVTQMRKNVQRQPDAYWYGRDLSFDDYMNARMISEPMCVLDTDIPVDGSASVVVTTASRARDLPNRPVYITDYARIRKQQPAAWAIPGTLGRLDDYYDGGFELAKRLWENSGWRPDEVDVVQLYGGFSVEPWFWLEVLGFCPQGEAWEFIQDGRIAPDGSFPLNTGGGSTGWGRLHGVVEVVESYLQLAGRAGERQQPRTDTAISTYADPAHYEGTAFLYSTDPSS